jgi:sugar phosphate isomerase/epimerase
MNRTISLSPLSLLPCSPLEFLDAAADAGYRTVGMRLQPAMDSDVDVLSDPGLMRAIEGRIAETGLNVLDIEVVRVEPATDVHALLPLLEFGGMLHASRLAVTSMPAAVWRAEEEALVTRKLEELATLAAPFGIKPMIEFMVFRGIARLEDAVRITSAIGHDAVGICVDALHLSRSGGTPDDVARIDPRLIACVQLCDAPAKMPSSEQAPLEARYDRLIPGQGGLPLHDLMAAVPLDVPVSIEVPMVARDDPLPFRAAKLLQAGRSVLGTST